jgi:hypothetical protein
MSRSARKEITARRKSAVVLGAGAADLNDCNDLRGKSMLDQAGGEARGISDFRSAPDVDGHAPDDERAAGARIFFRLNDSERLRLTAALIDAWLDHAPLNRRRTGAALREA